MSNKINQEIVTNNIPQKKKEKKKTKKKKKKKINIYKILNI